MIRYEYARVKVGTYIGNWDGEHRQIIDMYSAKGYRYVGHIPASLNEDGKVEYLDLIFEMNVDGVHTLPF